MRLYYFKFNVAREFVYVFAFCITVVCAFGQNDVSISSNPNPICIGSSYVELGQIDISENASNSIDFDINITKTLTFSLSSTNFVFQPMMGNVSVAGISSSITVTESLVSISFLTSTDQSTKNNVIAISGLRVKVKLAMDESGGISRAGGTLIISSGLDVGTTVSELISYSNQVISNAGQDKSICSTSELQLGGSPTATGGVGSYVYSWSPTAGLTSGDEATSNPNFNATTSVIHTFTVTVTDANNCVSTDDIQVTVVDIPSAPVVNNSTQTICLGSTMITPTATGNNLQWYSDVTLSPATLLSVVNPNSPTNLELGFDNMTVGEVTVYVTQTTSICQSPPTTVKLTVQELPTVDAGQDKSICSALELQLGSSPTATGGVGSYVYSWSPTAGLTSGDEATSNPNFNATTSVIHTFTVTVTDANNCVSTDDIQVTVVDIPSAPVVNNSTQTICLGSTIITPTATGNNLQWYSDVTLSPATLLSTVNPNSPTNLELGFDNMTVGEVTVYVTQTTGICQSPPTTVKLTVQELPTVDAGQDKSICSTLELQLGGSPTATGGVGSYVYSWSPTAGLTSGDEATSNPNFSATTSVIHTFTVTVTDANNCVSTDDIQVTVVDIPSAPVVNNSTQTICLGSTMITPTATGNNLQWYSDVTLSPATLLSTVNPNSPTNLELGFNNMTVGEVTVYVTQTTGICQSPPTTVKLTVQELPTVDAGQDKSICSTSELQLGGSPTATGGVGSYVYSWSPTAGLTSGDEATSNPNFNATTSVIHTFTVTVTDANNCVSTDDIQVTVVDIPSAPVVNNSTQTICLGSTMITPTATGNNLQWYSDVTLSPATLLSVVNPNSPTNLELGFDNMTVGEVTVYVTQTTSICQSPPTTVKLTVQELPTVDAGQDKSICSTSELQLGGSPTATGGVGSYVYSWSPTAGLTSGDEATSNPNFNATTSVIHTFTVTVTDANNCVSTDDIQVTVVDIPSAPVVNNSTQTICLGSTMITPTATGNNLQWYSDVTLSPATLLSVVNPNSPTNLELGFDNMTVGEVTVYVTQTTGICQSPPTTVKLTVQELPTVDAGQDKSICSTSELQLGGSPTATGGVGSYVYSWSPTAGLTSGDEATSNPNFSATTSVIHTFTVTVTDANNCVSTDDIQVTVVDIPSAPVVNNSTQTICLGSTMITPTATGNNLQWYSDVTLSPATLLSTVNPNSPTNLELGFNNMTVGEVTVYVTQTTGICQSPPTTVKLTVQELPTVDAGQDKSICSALELQLGSSPTATGGVGSYVYSWSPTAGLTSGDEATSNPNFSATTSVIHTFTVTVTDANNCVSTDDIQVTVVDIPSAPVVNNSTQTICLGSTMITPTATGNNLQWYSDVTLSPATLLSAVNPNSPTNLELGFDNMTVGEVTVYVTQTTGICQSPPTTVKLTVQELPTVDAGQDKSICSTSELQLGGSPTTTGGVGSYVYSWSPTAGLTSGDEATSNPNFSATTSVIHTFTVTVTDANNCVSTDDIQVTVVDIPSAPVVNNSTQTICLGSTMITPTATGNNLQWYSDVTLSPATLLSTVNPNSPTNLELGFDNMTVGEVTVYVTQTTGICQSPPTTVKLTVQELPTVDAGQDKSICSTSELQLGGSPTATGGVGSYVYSWSPTAGLTSGDEATSNPNFSATTSVIHTFTVTVTDANNCVSTDDIQVTVVDIPSAPVVNNSTQTICLGSTMITPTATGNNLQWYNDVTLSPATLLSVVNPNSPTNLELGFDNMTVGEVTVYVTQTTGICQSPPTTVKLTVQELPTVDAGQDKSICSTSELQLGGSPTATGGVGSYVYSWSPTAGLTSGDETTSNPNFNATTSVIHTFTVTVTDANNCVSTDDIQVTVVDIPSAPVVNNSTQTICLGSTMITPTATGNNLQWYSDVTLSPATLLSAVNPNSPTNLELGFDNMTVGEVTVYVTQTTGICQSPPTTVKLTVQELPTVDAGQDKSICSTSELQLGGSPTATGGVGSYVYSWSPTAGLTSGDETTSNPNFNATTSVIHTFTVTVTDANNCVSTDDIQVTVVDIPSAPVVNNSTQTICLGSTMITPTATGNNLQWYSDVTLSPATLLSTVNPNSPTNLELGFDNMTVGEVTVYVTQTTGICQSPPTTVKLTVQELPTVDAGQDKSICSALELQLGGSPTATGGVGSYVYSWSPTAGLTSGDETTSNPNFSATTSVIHTFTVTVTDGNNCVSTDDIQVTVNAVPVITNQNSINKCAGTSIPEIDLTASTDPGTTFNWDITNFTSLGLPIGTGTTGSIPSFILASNNTGNVVSGLVSVIATKNTCNSSPLIFNINIYPTPVGVTNSNLPEKCSGLGYMIDPTDYINNGVVSTYSWIPNYKNLQGGSGQGIGDIIETNTLKNFKNEIVNIEYLVTPTSIVGGCIGTPFTIQAPVLSEPVGRDEELPQTCSGIAVDYNLQDNINSISGNAQLSNFIWIARNNTFVTGESTTQQKHSIIIDVLNYYGSSSATITYDVIPTGTNGCVGTPFVLQVDVKSAPVATPTTTTSGICSKSAFNFNPQDQITNGVASDFIWTSSYEGGILGGSGLGVGNIAETLTQKTSSTLNATYKIIPTSGLCRGSEFTITVPIYPEPEGVTENAILCSKEPTNLTLGTAISVSSNSYSISVNSNGLTQSNGTNSEGNGKLSTELYDDAWINKTSLPVNVVYSVTPTSSRSCNGDIFLITLAVNPEPIGLAQTDNRCSNIIVDYSLIHNVSFLGNNVGSTFRWQATNNTSVEGENTTSQYESIIYDNLTNLSNTNQNVIYTATPTSVNDCQGEDFIITIVVHPKPKGSSVMASTICSNSTVNYDLQNNVNTIGNGLNSTFTWSASTEIEFVEGESTIIQSTSVINDELTNSSFQPQTVEYTINSRSRDFGCEGNPFVISVIVNPKIQINAGVDMDICNNSLPVKFNGIVTYAPNGVNWTGGSGDFDSDIIPNPNYSYADTEIYNSVSLMFTGNDPDGDGPCKSESDLVILTINPLPAVVINGLVPQLAQTPIGFDGTIIINGNNRGGIFSIEPSTSIIGKTFNQDAEDIDRAEFNPNDATVGINYVIYSFTDENGCSNSTKIQVIVNPKPEVDFSLEKATTNKFGQYEVCSNSGRLKLNGIPDASTGVSPTTEFKIESEETENGATITKIGKDYYLETDNVISEEYVIRYTFEDRKGAINFFLKSVKIFARPNPIIGNLAPKYCITTEINPISNSTIEENPFNDRIISVNWDFDEDIPDIVEKPSPPYQYSAVGVYTITLVAESSGALGCKNSVSQIITIGDLDETSISYSWSGLCHEWDTTLFLVPQFVDNDSIISHTWNFGDNSNEVFLQKGEMVLENTNGGNTTGTFDSLKHYYEHIGTYKTSLTINTNFGCKGKVEQLLFILPSVVVTKSSPYVEDFESSDGGWISIGSSASENGMPSWTWGHKTENGIASTSSGERFWVTGLNDNSYFPSEKSYLRGPCLNIDILERPLERPMISFDYWIDSQLGIDGAVIQYSVDGGFNWSNIGFKERGLNWYHDTEYITSNPGNQSTVLPLGWTGKKSDTVGWINGRFNLESIPFQSRESIQIRFAFASNLDNRFSENFKGFAFDNIFIGDKTKTVLVEHFSNSNLLESRSGDMEISNIFNEQLAAPNSISGMRSPDFQYIQYNIPYSIENELSNNYSIDHTSRALYYSVQNPPTSIMDGIIDGESLTGSYHEINRTKIDSRALESSLFNLKIDTIPTNDVHSINIQLSIIPNKTFSKSVFVQVALVEKMNRIIDDDSVKVNLLVQNLFGSTGLVLEDSFTFGQPKQVNTGKVEIVSHIINPNNLILVAYLQDKITREIYQSSAISAPSKRNIVIITNLTKNDNTELSNLSISPIPANGEINIGYHSNNDIDSYSWRLLDINGLILKSGDFIDSINKMKTIDVHDLSSGVYFIEILGSVNVIRKKVVVINRN